MIAFVLDSNSWHFKLANYGEVRIWDDEPTDICEYTRAVLKGATSLVALGLFFTFVAVWSGASLYNIFELLFLGSEKVYPWTGFFIGLCIATLIAVVYGAFKAWRENRRMDVPEPEPGFVKLAYRKFKDKTCARIEFKKKA
jgi:hypothetical protein